MKELGSFFCPDFAKQLEEHIAGCAECQKRFGNVFHFLKSEVPFFDMIFNRITKHMEAKNGKQ